MTKQTKVNYLISVLLVIALIICVIIDHCTISIIATIIAAVLIIGGTCLTAVQNKQLNSLEEVVEGDKQ